MTPDNDPLSMEPRDHGGGIDAAIARFGGERADWIDLSTGINPVPYPLPDIPPGSWMSLPDTGAQTALTDAARAFWNVPETAGVLAAPGASAIIAAIPSLFPADRVCIVAPTYNEHAAAFQSHGWSVTQETTAKARVLVSPNNPTGTYASTSDFASDLTVIDESFCDISPEKSLVGMTHQGGIIFLKSFGKFWGLAGLRLGFAIGDPTLISILKERLGPWPVAGPALHVGTTALSDREWSTETINRLSRDTARLDALVQRRGASVVGGTSLFRLYQVPDAADWQSSLARHHIWTRIFPYSDEWIRLGLPAPSDWDRLEAAMS